MCLARCRQRCEGHSIERLWAASAVYACRVPCPPVRCAYDLGGRTNPSDRVLLWKTLNQSESDALLSATEIAAMHGVGLRQRCCVRCRLTHGRVQGHGRAHGHGDRKSRLGEGGRQSATNVVAMVSRAYTLSRAGVHKHARSRGPAFLRRRLGRFRPPPPTHTSPNSCSTRRRTPPSHARTSTATSAAAATVTGTSSRPT